MLCNLGQRNFKSAAGHGRQNDIIEGSARRDGFDRVAARSAKETREWNRRHPLHPTVLIGWNQFDRHQFSGPHLDNCGLQIQGTLSYTQFNLKALRKLLILLERIGFFVRATCHRSSCAFRVSPQAIG